MTNAAAPQIAVKPLNKYATSLMSDHQSETLLGCMMADPEKLEALDKDMQEKRNFLWMVFTTRAKSVGLNLELNLVAFVVFGLLKNPAQSTQVVHAIYHDAKRRDTLGTVYTLNDFVMMFPNGFPTEAAYESAWNEQKRDNTDGGPDNKLDTDLFAAVWQ
jgi:hypothetical protein